MFNYLNGVQQALTTEYMIKFATLEGTFLYHGIITTCAFLFTLKFIKETEGLTDKEKKELYLDKDCKEEENNENDQKNENFN